MCFLSESPLHFVGLSLARIFSVYIFLCLCRCPSLYLSLSLSEFISLTKPNHTRANPTHSHTYAQEMRGFQERGDLALATATFDTCAAVMQMLRAGPVPVIAEV